MRRNSLLNFVIGLLMLAGIGTSQAQTTLTLMEWTNQWRYLITNALPPGGWTNVSYTPANGWPIGPAPLSASGTAGGLAHEPMPVASGVPASQTLLATNFNNTFVTSFYFRASINITSALSQLVISGTVVVDDGAVIYVNGREVQRLGVAAGAVTHNTFASRGGEVTDAGRVETFSIASSNFVQGANVIAVSVHQQNGTSSDVAFGMRITAQVILPVAITAQPEDQEVDAGLRATFSVTATGTTPRYQWFSNNVAILNATNSSYQTPVATLAMNGWIYHVVVSNQLGFVRSSNAVLRVVIDRSGPIIQQALVTQTNQMEIRFNETLLNQANPTRNPTNFIIHLLGTTNKIAVTNVVYGVNQLRLFANTNLDPDNEYVLCFYNLVDARTNVINPNPTCVGVSFTVSTNVFPLASPNWRFADVILDDRMDRTNWTSPAFIEDPADWASGAGMFWFDQVNFNPSCSLPTTELVNFPGTQYFRKQFSVGSDLGTSVTVRVTCIVDDAAVFYINGTEIQRINMPPGPVVYSTRPVAELPDSTATNCQTFTVAISGSLLNVGSSNVFAVELHQVTDQAQNNDMVFDAEMAFTYRRTPTVPTLNFARTYVTNLQGRVTQTNVVVSWSGGTGWTLQHAVSPTGPWSTVTGVVNNRYQTTVPQQGPRRFYRLRNP